MSILRTSIKCEAFARHGRHNHQRICRRVNGGASRKLTVPVTANQPDRKSQEKEKASVQKSDDGYDGATGPMTGAAKLAAELVASPLFYLVAGFVAIKLVASTGEQSLSIFIFAALPVTLLTLLSKSELGKDACLAPYQYTYAHVLPTSDLPGMQKVQQQLEERLPELDAKADEVKARHAQARQTSPWFGPGRPRLPGPFGSASHLQGLVAGDAGFDPLGLSTDPAAFARNYEAELVHARWAMLAAIGCLIPELLSMQGVELGEPVWWKVGAAKLNDDLTLNWGGIQGFRIAGKQGIGIIVACQLVLMGGPEYARYVGIRSLEPVGVHLPGDSNYPGGAPFDPLGFSGDAAGFVDQSVKEIKNGRLAMVAMLGYFVQAAVTRQGPVQNLVDFVADPAHNNIFKYLV